jgi:dTDP-4-amino-4,6-dideoxygalactose transaminase
VVRAHAVGREPEIPLFDLRMEPQDLDSVAVSLRSGELAAGTLTAEFESRFETLLGSHFAVAVSSGTAALHLAYLASAVGPGGEVIVPAITFVATASAVVHCGAKPVIVDVLGDHDLSIDPDQVQQRLTSRTKAVWAVHYGGYAAPVDHLAELCADHALALVEDAAHAPAASLSGRALGTWGAAGAFSFFSNKVLSAGEGGLVAISDADAAGRIRRLRAADDPARQHDIEEPRFNYALDEPRAALLLSRLERMGDEITRRRQLTSAYRGRLERVAGVTVPYTDAQVAASSCYIMPVVLEDPRRRDAVRARMRDEHGVQTSVCIQQFMN